MHKPPGPEPRSAGPLATLRYAGAMLTDSIGFVGERFARYGGLYNAPSGGTDLYVVKRPDDVRSVLVTDAESYDKSHTAFEALTRILGQGLLTTEGEVWRRHRRLANPAFAQQAITGYVPEFVAEGERFAASLTDGEALPIAAAMTRLTLGVVGRTLLGAESVADLALIAKAMERYQMFLAAPRSLPGIIRAPIDRAMEGPHREVTAMLLRAIGKRRSAPVDPPDLMQMLVSASDPEAGKLSEQELVDELLTFLLAGHETTSNTLAWAFSLLARDDAARARAVREARALPRPLTAEHLPALAHTQRVIKEALRLYPPAYVVARRANRATTLGGYDVAKGTEVVVWIFHTHRDPAVFDRPDAFLPDRFERESEWPRGAFVPFGAGPRACIGKSFALVEATALMAAVHQRAELLPLSAGLPRPRPRITLSPSARHRLRVRVGGR